MEDDNKECKNKQCKYSFIFLLLILYPNSFIRKSREFERCAIAVLYQNLFIRKYKVFERCALAVLYQNRFIGKSKVFDRCALTVHFGKKNTLRSRKIRRQGQPKNVRPTNFMVAIK